MSELSKRGEVKRGGDGGDRENQTKGIKKRTDGKQERQERAKMREVSMTASV